MVQQSLVSSDHWMQNSSFLITWHREASFFSFESLGCYFSRGITLYSSFKKIKKKSNYKII